MSQSEKSDSDNGGTNSTGAAPQMTVHEELMDVIMKRMIDCNNVEDMEERREKLNRLGEYYSILQFLNCSDADPLMTPAQDEDGEVEEAWSGDEQGDETYPPPTIPTPPPNSPEWQVVKRKRTRRRNNKTKKVSLLTFRRKSNPVFVCPRCQNKFLRRSLYVDHMFHRKHPCSPRCDGYMKNNYQPIHLLTYYLDMLHQHPPHTPQYRRAAKFIKRMRISHWTSDMIPADKLDFVKNALQLQKTL